MVPGAVPVKIKGGLEAGTARRSKAGHGRKGRRGWGWGGVTLLTEEMALWSARRGHFPCLLRAGGKLRPQKGKGS